jgi:hypothetical protein
LTISLVVLVAGNVDVLGIVHVYIGVLLRLSYLQSGDINADGTLNLKIRITRFFKLKVRRNVRYKLKGKSGGSSNSPGGPSGPFGIDAAAPAANNKAAIVDARVVRFLESLR